MASKTEEARLVDHPPRLEDFRPVLAQYRERGNVTLEEIEQSEINVLSVVGKTLTVHHPFKPILGMIGDVFKTYAGVCLFSALFIVSDNSVLIFLSSWFVFSFYIGQPRDHNRCLWSHLP